MSLSELKPPVQVRIGLVFDIFYRLSFSDFLNYSSKSMTYRLSPTLRFICTYYLSINVSYRHIATAYRSQQSTYLAAPRSFLEF